MQSNAQPLDRDPYSTFNGLSEAEWRDVLMQSIREPVVRGVQMPRFPEDGTQVLFTSLKNEQAMSEAFAYYELVKRAGQRLGHGWNANTKLLDFGVGWGRIARTFLKDVRSENLHGFDINEAILHSCRKLVPYGTFNQCHIGKPFDAPDSTYDVVTGFSVFSHLSEPNHQHWLNEIHRVLKPGGVAVLTTLTRQFFAQCEGSRLAVSPPDNFSQCIQRLLAENKIRGFSGSFLNYPDDQYFYLATGGGIAGTEAENYGWTVVPYEYARRHWSDRFEVCEYISALSPFEQAAFVLRKPDAATQTPWAKNRRKLVRFVRHQPGGERVIQAAKIVRSVIQARGFRR